MDEGHYSTLVVGRGLKFCYYFSPPQHGAPTLLFLHGVPSSSADWKRQVAYFQPKGYGILAPDLLGAGRTDQPADWTSYRINHMAQDIIDILDHETSLIRGAVIGVGHDWGCNVLSRLSILHSARFNGFCWLGLSYMEPITDPFDLPTIMVQMKQLLGYEGYSYWEFFTRPGAADLIKSNIDSFLQLLYPKRPEDWRVYMALPGKTEEWITTNMQPGWPEYITKEEFDTIRQNLSKEGSIQSCMNWYISQMHNNDLEDNRKIPVENWKLSSPSFFAVASKDSICTPVRGKATMAQYGVEVTTVEYDTGHWVHLEATEEVNNDLHSWLLKHFPTA